MIARQITTSSDTLNGVTDGSGRRCVPPQFSTHHRELRNLLWLQERQYLYAAPWGQSRTDRLDAGHAHHLWRQALQRRQHRGADLVGGRSGPRRHAPPTRQQAHSTHSRPAVSRCSGRRSKTRKKATAVVQRHRRRSCQPQILASRLRLRPTHMSCRRRSATTLAVLASPRPWLS